MILGPVSYFDCLIFCLLLAPQLIWHVGLFETVFCALSTLPFLRKVTFLFYHHISQDHKTNTRTTVLKLPTSFIYERYLLPPARQPPFVRQATFFEDLVVRCVRYAFANIPPSVGHVFFCKQVALPFLGWRMLRHGYLTSPIHWREQAGRGFRGVWIIADPEQAPDVVLYYAHGGGFSMGSPYFYLEFLISWLGLLREAGGYANPAIFALEYTLVPEGSYPTQLGEAVAGYRHVLTVARDPSIVAVGGDSAGAMLVLSMLLHLAAKEHGEAGLIPGKDDVTLQKPNFAVLISPWVTLVSPVHKNNTSDYLDVDTLHRYGLQYTDNRIKPNDPLVSPGSCKDVDWWRRAAPTQGIFITYGEEEVFQPDIKQFVRLLRKAGVAVGSQEAAGGIHAWPVASLFLASSREKRLRGLRCLVEKIRERVPPGRERVGVC
ncbi:Arylacetamide deacetylase-like protein [Coniochaeta sp. 2T2.1]|nr:Arylacetamide deacetylase-like protein [Coniochaeta sp. 2T2.1]